MSRYVICDIEATGLHEDNEPIEIALITIDEEDKVIDVYETLINPLTNPSEFIQNLTSITAKELTLAPKFYDVADAIRMRLEGNIFVSHKTEFDLGLLKKKYREMGQDLSVKSFCTLTVAQHEIPGLLNYNLQSLCSFFSIKFKQRHRALNDAQATLELFKELRELRLKAHSVERFLPQHAKALDELPARAGLLKLKNEEGKIIHLDACVDLRARARKLLEVSPANRELLQNTTSIAHELTGSALIAEFRKLAYNAFRPLWFIDAWMNKGEVEFRIYPYKKGKEGLWYFMTYPEAKKKLNDLKRNLKGDSFAYREGRRSKEEILKHNALARSLMREAVFPAENLVLIGEGRQLNEKSLILVRDGHVLGYGYTEASEEEIYAHSENFITHRYNRNVGADRSAQRYLRELRNRAQKNEGWRSLAEHDKLNP